MKKNKLILNIFIYILINIMLLILSMDYIIYFTNIKYIFSFCISTILLLLMNYIFHKKNLIELRNEVTKSDIIFYILLGLILIITIPYPDRSFDTINYHLYLQENPFGDKIFYDFFAGKNLNSFSYAFPDRLFYLFRYFFGYRLGVIFNYFLIIVLYYQVKFIIKKLNSDISEFALSILSTFIVLGLSIIDFVDSYYIDLISLVLLVEIIKITLFDSKLNPKNNNDTKFMYIGILYGFTFATKISNAVMLILFFIIYLLINKNLFRCLNIKNILLTLVMFLFPFILYFTYTYMQTKNPVFPFYNTIFHSEFFDNRNWLDTRFGPSRLLEVAIWPIIIIFKPERCVDTAIVEPMWCFGYIISILYFIYYFLKILKHQKVDSLKFIFFIITVFSYLVWSKFQLGYSRYGLIVLVLGSISVFTFVYEIIRNKKYVLIGLSISLMLYNYSYSVNNYMNDLKFWIYDNYYNNPYDYKYNLENIFKDGKQKIKLEKNTAWAIFYCNAGMAQMINSDIPMLNVTYGADNAYTKKILDKKLNSYDKIYTVTDSLDLNNFLNEINKTDFIISNVKKVISSSMNGNKNEFIYIFEITKQNKKMHNEIMEFQNEYKYTINSNKNFSVKFWIGIQKSLNKIYKEPFYIEIVGKKDGNETLIDFFKINVDGKLDLKKYDVNNEKFDNFLIRAVDKNHQEINDAWLMLLNFNIIEED